MSDIVGFFYYFIFVSVGIVCAYMLWYTRLWGYSQPSLHRDVVGKLCCTSYAMIAYCLLKITRPSNISVDVLELIAQLGVGFLFNVAHYKVLKVVKCEGCRR